MGTMTRSHFKMCLMEDPLSEGSTIVYGSLLVSKVNVKVIETQDPCHSDLARIDNAHACSQGA